MDRSSTLWVNGVVAVRDGLPYVQLSNEHGIFAKLSMAEARQVAADILQMSARTEADALLHKFFSEQDYPPGANTAVMMAFRDFRAKLDQEVALRGSDNGEPT